MGRVKGIDAEIELDDPSSTSGLSVAFTYTLLKNMHPSPIPVLGYGINKQRSNQSRRIEYSEFQNLNTAMVKPLLISFGRMHSN